MKEGELFQGLYIYDQPWEWKAWPVLRFDFSIFSEIHEPELLEDYIREVMNDYAVQYGIEFESNRYDRCFDELLTKLPDQAVILIDEYDKPILKTFLNLKRLK